MNFGLLFDCIFLTIRAHIAVEIQILKLPLFRQLTINLFLACELLLSQIFLNKCSASTTESTIPFAKKFSWYKKKNMADRISIYKAKTNSFFEDIYVYLEFRGWRLSERRLDICIFQITLVSLQIMPGKGLPYWKIHESDLVNLYLVTIWQKSGNFKFLKSMAMCICMYLCFHVMTPSLTVL